MESKAAMETTFGAEIGGKLYGAAVRLSCQYGIDLDDVASEITVAAFQIQASYGFVHVNTAVNRSKNALFSTNYGDVNRYYDAKGVTVMSLDVETEDGGTLADTLAVTSPDAFEGIDVALVVERVVKGLSDRDQAIARAWLQEIDPKEVARQMGCHFTTIYNRIGVIRGLLAAALTA